MKIALAQLNYHIGNFEENSKKIIKSISEAKKMNADLIVFSELAISGYPPRDFLEFNSFIEECYSSVEKIAKHCDDIAAIIGMPLRNESLLGKNLFNGAVFIENGEIKNKTYKTLLPTYDIFDEYRYFERNSEFEIIEFKGKKIALTICEDLWDIGEDPLYVEQPMERLIEFKPDLMINIAASPFHYRQAEIRKNVLIENVKRYDIPLFYVNHVGAQTELIFDGGSCAIDTTGEVFKELKYFEEDLKVFDLDDVLKGQRTKDQRPRTKDEGQNLEMELIYKALVIGVQNYFNKLGFKKAILGLSGGIDSALTLAIAVEALGPENVLSLLMPSKFSSDHSVDDSVKMCKHLGSPYHIVSIEKGYDSVLETVNPWFKDLAFNVTEENIQARLRGVLLMAFSNKFGSILLNTSNKSEAAVGYGTLYGDMCGGISVIGDLYKTQVYELSRWINRDDEIIPDNIITKAPSAELRPNQFDSDSLPDYDILDTILYEYIENRLGPNEIIALGYEPKLVRRILRLVNLNEYKRYQTPPMLRISSKAFGMGRRMPIVGKYLS